MFRADLHIHSPYSQAASKYITFDLLTKTAKKKGIKLLGTGDTFYPEWVGEITSLIKDEESGFFKVSDFSKIMFTPTVEVSCEWDRKRAHVLIVFPPELEQVSEVRAKLGEFGKFHTDGRPIVWISPLKLDQKVKSICPTALVIPAHVMTPWFGLFGWSNHIDTLEEVYGNDKPDALETGLSADPTMIKTIESLKDIPLVSFSDAHSLPNLGRELTVFKCELNYEAVSKAIKSGDFHTIEYPPQLGKYYFDGHRECGYTASPIDSPICPTCKRKVTLGVARRIKELGNGQTTTKHSKLNGGLYCFKLLDLEQTYSYQIPLRKIISLFTKDEEYSKEVRELYSSLVLFATEAEILSEFKMDSSEKELAETIKSFLIHTKHFGVLVRPGYDGVFGELKDMDEHLLNLLMEGNKSYKNGEKCINVDKFSCTVCIGRPKQRMCEAVREFEKISKFLDG